MRSNDCGSSISWQRAARITTSPHRCVLQGEFHESAFGAGLKESDRASRGAAYAFQQVTASRGRSSSRTTSYRLRGYDLSQLPDEEKAAEALRLIRGSKRAAIRSESDLMLRVRWLQLTENVHLILFTRCTTSSVDGWSIGDICSVSWRACIRAYCHGESPIRCRHCRSSMPTTRVWQRQLVARRGAGAGIVILERQLAELPPVHEAAARQAAAGAADASEAAINGFALAGACARIGEVEPRAGRDAVHVFADGVRGAAGPLRAVSGTSWWVTPIAGRTHREWKG